MPWAKISLGDLVPEQVSTAVDVAGTTVEALASTVKAIASALDIVASIALADIDLTAAAIKAAVSAVENALANLKKPSSFHGLAIPVHLGTNTTLFNRISESLEDLGDHHRPLYSRQDVVAGVLMVYGEPNFAAIVDQLVALGKLFAGFGLDGLDGNAIPVPRNLKARVISTPQITLGIDPVTRQFG